MLPKTYSSTALVQVKSVGENGAVVNGRTTSDLNLDTEAQLVTSIDVASRAKDILVSDDSARDLIRSVSVTVPANTSVLSIEFDAESPISARRGAQAFADAYLANRKSAAESDIQAQADAIRSQIRELQTKLDSSNKKLSSAKAGSAERADAQATSSALSSQIRELNSQLTPLAGQTVTPGSVITAAQTPESASSPSKKLVLASCLLSGLVAGCLVAFAVDRHDRRVRDRKDLDRLGLDTMTGIVDVPAVRDAGSSLVGGRGAEALRQLRNALLAQMPERSGAVLVANASDSTAGSAVSVSLAVTVARSGTEVVLLSANTERCAVEQAFEVPVQPGLVDVLRARADLQTAVFEVREIPHLKVIPAGADASLTSDLLQGSAIETVISELTQMAEVVVIDVAPTSANADAQTLTTATDGVLLVATALRTRQEDVLEAVDQFGHVSARIFGAVVVNVRRERGVGAASRRAVSEVATAARRPLEADDVQDPHHDADSLGARQVSR